ncbi:hypothetical protein POM88_029728 [Heracleum sosnowskyi]|uniref:Uncharacterized protein n=1 Tax=Heracleum sosnowskyi TaxID=360622 RepID=A0AAD8HUM6_9APIA|nr:hypothetical protein POM88_029728 [Heracleum sosnowskyi]
MVRLVCAINIVFALQANQKEAQKAKESALAQLEEEMCLLKATEPANKRKHATLHLKIETDVQCHKDELQRLELELSGLKVSLEASQLNLHSTNPTESRFMEDQLKECLVSYITRMTIPVIEIVSLV